MTTLRQGDRGCEVLELQLLLGVTGFPPGPYDGVYGPRTRAAVEHFEQIHGYDVTGAADFDVIDNLRGLPRRAVELPRFATPVTLEDVRRALCDAYTIVFAGHDVDGSVVRVALAHLAEEHALVEWTSKVAREHPHPSWFAPAPGTLAYPSAWVNNLGNRQVRREDRNAVHLPTVPFFDLVSREVIDGKDRQILAEYYAHASLREGAAAYWAALRDHYPAALAAMEVGDPALTARELKREGWYTGSEADYERAMVSVWKRVG